MLASDMVTGNNTGEWKERRSNSDAILKEFLKKTRVMSTCSSENRALEVASC